ncbi:MAG TPA: S41 family peptidase [Bryobacteraceae bacterium]|nr:S41 family peptidase [Bryobacteraceae bacterium]
MVCAALWAVSAAAQNLTPSQKEADFRFMVSLYNTYYAPLAWKKAAVSFDALDIKPWIDKVAATTTDLDFYEVCVQYISSLNDSHAGFIIPSDFNASLGFGVDIYDGALLIDNINRTVLPSALYPFGLSDELVSIDGVDAQEIASELAKYVPQGNPRASMRQGAARLTSRAQSRFPHAPDLPESATVVIKGQDGILEIYTIPWVKTGTPMEAGPVPSPMGPGRTAVARLDPLEELQYSGVSRQDTDGVLGYGARNPVFLAGLPSTFARRLGANAADFFYSGVFTVDDLKIGYLRIPHYAPPSQPMALAQFEAEIRFMNENTDGLVIDEMRNTGGNLCFGENIAVRLHQDSFRVTGFELRAYYNRMLAFYNSWINAINTGMPAEAISQYELLYKEMLVANQAGAIVTKTLPLCTSSLTRKPVFDQNGVMLAYRKPIMVIIDDFSTSTADSFAAILQDSGRALLYGMRTNGAGGNNISLSAGAYSETTVGMTIALQVRPKMFASPEFPATQYIENVGVRPDVENDYMTKENLLGNGAKFVDDFLQAMAAYIRGQTE